MSELAPTLRRLTALAQERGFENEPLYRRARAFLVDADTASKIYNVPPLLSVEKLASVDALFQRGVKYQRGCYLQPKYDGVSVSAVYFALGGNHWFLYASTKRGKSCCVQLSEIIPSIRNMAMTMDNPENFVVLRGELVLKDKTAFPGFVSPRTAATSYINTKVPQHSERYTVKWFDMYEVTPAHTYTKIAIEERHKVPEVFPRGKQDIIDFMQQIQELPEFCDGVVLKAPDDQVSSYSSTAHHPKWSAALKFASPTAESIVTNIYYTTGETGRVTPVIEIEPILISGTRIAKVSGGSEDVVQQKGITIGSRVLVELAGLTIPHIKEVI